MPVRILSVAEAFDGMTTCRAGRGPVPPEEAVVPPGTLFAGVPGKVLRDLTADESRRVATNALSYIEYARRYRSGELG